MKGREIIWIIYSYHETNSLSGFADSIEDFMAIRLVGGNFKKFFDHWRFILAGIVERPDDNTLEAFFVR